MSRPRRPVVVVLAGPNGAGKSTVGPTLLKETLGVMDFVNADTIAQGLSAFRPEGAAIQAGRVVLARLDALARARRSFAFESTLAGRSLAVRLGALRKRGYKAHFIFLWLPTPDLAVKRVAGRVKMGGHDVPEVVIRRRYRKGLRNFFKLYLPLADGWRLYDNSAESGPVLIASAARGGRIRLADKTRWAAARKGRG